jgi:KaiC/GvpD/RAD55 family RecA-like ATPase
MPKETRVATGVPGLDEMLLGGFVPGTAVLVRGAPGCGKTSLSLQYLVHGARNNEPGLLISFEEFPVSIHRDAESLGWNLSELEEAGQLHLMFTSPQVLLDSLASRTLHDSPATASSCEAITIRSSTALSVKASLRSCWAKRAALPHPNRKRANCHLWWTPSC